MHPSANNRDVEIHPCVPCWSSYLCLLPLLLLLLLLLLLMLMLMLMLMSRHCFLRAEGPAIRDHVPPQAQAQAGGHSEARGT